MLYINVTRENGKAVSAQVLDDYNVDAETRNDWRTFEAAKEVAAVLGSGYIATDAGSHVSPRYDVCQLPKIGDKVSYAFNGDSYPCGIITAISKSLKVISTSEGKKFYRVRESGCRKNAGTWSLVNGHHYKQNPSF